jgi:hypothetical protein
VSEGRHVDLFGFLLFGYRYPAAPQDLREGWLLKTEVDGPVDRDRLVDAVERVLRPNQFILDETWSHHSAGRDQSTLEIGIGVPNGVGAGIVDELVPSFDPMSGALIPAELLSQLRRPQVTREGCWRREGAFPRTPSWLRKCASSHPVSN